MSLLKCAAIFSDHMVLQRNKNIKIWGTASNFTDVIVTIGDNKTSCYVKENKWTAVLPPMEAGGPYEVTVSDGNGNKLVFKDIMVGEVWFAGGQSNMELELINAKNGREYIKNSEGVNVRYYYTKKNPFIDEYFYLDERDNSWFAAKPCEEINHWSAVAYFYAKKLSEELGVTVGIIGCNWGGTSASAWISRKMLGTDTDTKTYLDEYDTAMGNKSFEAYCAELDEYDRWYNEWQPKINEFYSKNPHGVWGDALEFAGPSRWPGPLGPKSPYRPSGLYETMVKRVMPYTIAGFIYYQGESDDHKPVVYYKLLKMLIEQWRCDWEDDTLPFLFVQLPMHIERGDTDYKHWCKVRESQYRVHKTTANTGLAVALDCGEYGNIHPIDKKPVGERLCLQALYHVYKRIEAGDAYGAFYKSHVYENGGVTVFFEYNKGGFEIRGGKITGFEIAGADKKFAAAEAEIKGDGIFVKSGSVAKPEYVRYNWTNYAEVTVFSKATGIPLAPFRTSVCDE